jgi:hypothetical protein
VAFIPPVQNGGSSITSYTVTSSGGQTATGASSPIVVTGLTTGTSYTFTVTATNALGTSISSGTSNSATPAITDPYFSSVVLLLNGDTITDLSSSPKTITAYGNTQISTSIKKYGTGSMYFDGTGDYLGYLTNSSTTINGTEDFTIEAWLNPNLANTYHCFYSSQWAIQCYMTSSRVIEIYLSSSATTSAYFAVVSSTGAISLNQWSHIAITRNGSNIRLFINGVLNGTADSTTASIGAGTAASIGSFNSGNQYTFSGYMDDLRITKGIARYTTNFTPPTASFPTS